MGKNPLPLIQCSNTLFSNVGCKLPSWWNAPFEGKVDPFFIRPFDPEYDPYTWTSNIRGLEKPNYPYNWKKDTATTRKKLFDRNSIHRTITPKTLLHGY